MSLIQDIITDNGSEMKQTDNVRGALVSAGMKLGGRAAAVTTKIASHLQRHYRYR